MSIEGHRNPDGTYDGVGVMSELSGLARYEVSCLFERVKANSAKLNACPWHEFEMLTPVSASLSKLRQRYRCRHCGGEVDASAYHWHEMGRRPGPQSAL